MDFLIVICISYLSGSIPFGIILTKTFGKKNLTKIGSGNIGATNVLRSGYKFLELFTLLLDILKGYLPVIIVQKYFPELIYLSCMVVFLGHIFPIWLKFKGGKRVATYLGILFALSHQLSFLFIATWIVVFLIFRYSSLASMFSSLTVFIISLIRETISPIFSSTINSSSNNLTIFLFIFFILIIFTHKKNIHNLKNKIEPKIKL